MMSILRMPRQNKIYRKVPNENNTPYRYWRRFLVAKKMKKKGQYIKGMWVQCYGLFRGLHNPQKKK